jgi:hypothetical protein
MAENKNHSAFIEQVRRQASQVRNDEIQRRANLKRRLKADKQNRIKKRMIKIAILSGIVLVVMFMLFEFLLPGSYLKKKKVIDDTPLEDVLETALEDISKTDKDGDGIPDDLEVGKPYAKLEGTTEEKLLWDLLMDYFDGNKAAVLGVMCNLHAESNLTAANLEDYNNRLWDITDDIYTEEVNRRTIDKKDFLESRTVDSTNGYYNENDEWVNRDGGYGYAQFTAYDKKESLYQFAEQWFGPGGKGENYRFNIGDPEMQANYVIYLLQMDEYHEMEDLIRHADVTVDACYYWLKMYEEPYDPYCDNYYTLAFDRAAVADQIEARCTGSILNEEAVN